MADPEPLTIGIVAGEESGDLLAADLVRALEQASGRPVKLVGVGGEHLRELGLKTLFSPDEIGLMGISAVLRDAPRLFRRIGQTTRALAEAKPACLITVDVPDFSLRVARKVRSLSPGLPAVQYVCPSIWAWRQGRAADMAAFIDHVLCILPFEPRELARLGGPPGTYVGHRLTHDAGVVATRAARRARAPVGIIAAEGTLLLLPGSRRGEVSRLLPDFRETVSALDARGFRGRLLLPTVPKVASAVRAGVSGWDRQPEILEGQEAKWQAFAQADAALIASGTVSLELALCGVPHVSTYRLDPLGRALKGLIRSWTASLPNLIADRMVIPEFFDADIRPPALARYSEALLANSDLRRWQMAGFDTVAEAMQTDKPAGVAAAEIVLDLISRRNGTKKAGQRLAIGT